MWCILVTVKNNKRLCYFTSLSILHVLHLSFFLCMPLITKVSTALFHSTFQKRYLFSIKKKVFSVLHWSVYHVVLYTGRMRVFCSLMAVTGCATVEVELQWVKSFKSPNYGKHFCNLSCSQVGSHGEFREHTSLPPAGTCLAHSNKLSSKQIWFSDCSNTHAPTQKGPPCQLFVIMSASPSSVNISKNLMRNPKARMILFLDIYCGTHSSHWISLNEAVM